MAQGNTLLFEYSTTYHKPERNIYHSKLFANKDSSTFYWNDKTEEKNEFEDSNLTISVLDSIGTINQINYSNQQLLTSYTFGRRRLIKEPVPLMNWKLASGTKIILGYTCKKAELSFRGRDYTAWYTNEIPLNTGPWKFTGLPGAILEAYDANQQINFKCYKITYHEDYMAESTTTLLNASEFISIQEYISLADNYMKKIVNAMKSQLPRGARVSNIKIDNYQLEIALEN